MKILNFIKTLPALIIAVVFAGPANAQLVNCNAFLKGNYVEVGININGAFGSSQNAPSGYHPRGGQTMYNTCLSACSGSSTLGWVADPDRDGWSVGTPSYIGDYFLPGNPQEGWSLEVNGVQSNAWNELATCAGASLFSGTLTGTNVTYSNNGIKSSAIWEGVDGNGIAVRQTTTLDTGNLFFTIFVTLTNTSSSAKTNIYYMRSVDPDNEVSLTGGPGYVTTNVVDYQLPNALNATLVSATGAAYSSFLGLGTLDCRAKCFFNNATATNALTPNAIASDIYAGTSSVDYTGSIVKDGAIGLVFNIGTLAAGDSASFAYAYILNTSDITNAFKSTLPNWTATGDTASAHVVNDTAKVCENTLTTVSITNPGTYTWSWIALTGETLSAYTGPSTQVTTGTTIIELMAISVDGCTGLKDTLFINLNPIKPLPNNPTASSSSPVCQGTSLNLTSSTTTPGTITYTWRGPSGYISPLQNPTITNVPLAAAGTYTVTAYLSGCPSAAPATTTVTVNPQPAAITGTASVCIGSTTTLSNATSSGTWISSSTGVATIGSSSGIVTGVAAGTSTISYRLTTTGCVNTRVVTVVALPSAITGVAAICAGSASPLSNASGSGTWSSANSSVATVNSSGVVSALTIGTATISFTLTSSGCVATRVVTVNAALPSIAGTAAVCLGQSTILSNATTGGTWTSSNSTVASVGGSTGLVIGLNSGTTTITYSTVAGCYALRTVTVNPLPASISGTTVMCVGATATLSTTTTGGTWSSVNTAIATVGSGTGIVTGVSAGTTSITYTSSAGCNATRIVTVSPAPTAILPTGGIYVCPGFTAALSNATLGGTWSSTATSVVSITSLGVASGVTFGTAIVSYTMPGGCAATTTVTVSTAPGGVSPSSAAICEAATVSLSDATSGGSWSSNNTSLATVNSSTGLVTGVSGGIATISYSIGFCYATSTVTVNANPAAITPSGASTICTGTTLALSDATPSGTWSSSSTVASVTSGGLVSGVAVGVANISYVLGTGCFVTKPVTVNTTPVAIVPSSVAVCEGASAALTNATSGGAWSSNNTAIATVSSGGSVTGIAAGTTTITYAIGSCFTTATVSVNTTPVAITPSGAASVCIGATTTLSDATPSGAWSSSSTAATVSSAGVVTGVSAGVVTISYTTGSGCFAVKTVTVNPTPVAITPSSVTVCEGASASLTNTTSGGTWSSNNTAIATVSSGGSVTGVIAGTATITYAIGTCVATATASVNANPLAITPSGAVSVCIGSTTALSNATPSGVWSSSSTAATVSSTGVVSGISTGTVTISYTNLAGCAATKQVAVNSTPSAIIPSPATICQGVATLLSDAVTGGSWSSNNTAVVTITSFGLATGVTSGTATISYAIGSCFTTTTVTVNANPAAITPSGAATVCTGATLALSDASPGGTWTSSSTAATVSTGGLVSGIATGVVTISYTNAAGCSATKPVTVNATPGAIAPATPSVCVGRLTNLTNATSGGTWSSSNTSVAVITSGGAVTGLSAGTTTISYAVGGCPATVVFTVNANPPAITPSGSVSVCSGGTTALSNTTPGGNWSSNNTTIATVSAGGVVSGVAAGAVTISYTTISGCFITKSVSVTPAPAAILPLAPTACVGIPTNLSDAVTGGTWTSGNTSVATIGVSSGTVTGVAAGTLTITYAIGSCSVTTTLTVNPLAIAGSITGPSSACAGTSITLSDAAPGGRWSSSNTAIATVGTGSGIVTGISGGTATISYSVTNGCGTVSATAPVTIIALPTAGTIAGASLLCAGTVTTMSDAILGGIWTSSNTGVATILTSGLLTGVAVGTTTISYTVVNACGTATATKSVTVGAFLTAGSITGPSAVCESATITLTDPATGGAWSSSSSNATVAGGVVTGVTAGTATISYTVTSACGSASATQSITVNPLPVAGTITGLSSVCIGSVTVMSNTATGGIWSSSNTNATITSTGLLTPISPGTATISYTVVNGCGVRSATKVVTLGAFLTAGTISGPSAVCAGATITLTDPAPAGTWSSSTANATVSSTGVVTGVSAGTSEISYTVSSSCGTLSAVQVVTVIALPDAGSISGPSAICLGSPTTYTNTATGGLWSTSNTNASVTSGGVVTPLVIGSSTITYTSTTACGSASATLPITIGAFLTAGSITGPGTVCVSAAVTLTDAAPGGVWSSSNANASVSGGVITGVTAGTADISYTVTSACGTAVATAAVTVNPLPDAGTISGPASICLGAPTTYSNAATGGAWSVSNTNASVTSGGLVTPLAMGTATISYTVANSCGTATATQPLTVGAFLSAGTITGPDNVCAGSFITLSDAISGGAWSSSNANATVSGGVVTGLSGGVATISYTVTSSCGSASATQAVTVNPLPVAGPIVGPSSMCIGSPVSYTATPGGSWSISNANATISSSGVLTPLLSGTSIISYTLSNSCGTDIATKTIAIGLPDAGVITGPTAICIASSVTLANAAPGGVWTSSNPSVASITPGGVVTGTGSGTANISYTVTSPCGSSFAITTVTTSLAPPTTAGTILGPASICAGTFTIYSSTVPGGVWSLTNANATITGAGVFSAVTPFSADTVLYAVVNGCGSAVTSKAVSIGVFFSAGSITGSSTVCTGSSIALSNAVTGGVWSISNANATISPSGLVTAVAAGVDTVYYTVTGSCGTAVANKIITIGTFPNAGTITGPSSVCLASTITLSNTSTGGIWSASNANATVNSSGVVTGVAMGAVTISYTISTFCGSAFTTKSITVDPVPVPGAISGVATLCASASTTFTHPTPGGVWSSSNTAAATVAAGVVTGVAGGTSIISYAIANGCGTSLSTATITINPLPGITVISGPSAVCVGSLIVLTNTTPGGVWSSNNANATITGSGIVTGIFPGIDTISYTVFNACGASAATKVVTVNAFPAIPPITGPGSVCVGASITLSNAQPGGVWISISPAIATVGSSSGIVTGVLAGSDVVVYTVTNACGTVATSTSILVTTLPDAGTITGGGAVCTGATLALANAAPGGVWSSGSALATVSSTGVVTGVAAGTANISYTVTNGCGTNTATTTVTVDVMPVAATISGASTVCEGASTMLANSIPGGVWLASNSNAVISSTGVVTGVASGLDTMFYSITNSCGTAVASKIMTVNPAPAITATSGPSSECVGASVTLTNSTSGGIWSSSNTGVATVGASSGMVNGLAAGTATISYTVSNSFGCTASATYLNTVLSSPVVPAITGSTGVCVGATTALSNTETGGVWASGNIAVASIDAAGVVTGASAGTAVINYTVTGPCGVTTVTTTVTVVSSTAVAPVTGPSNVCESAGITLSSATPGGIWSSSNTFVATVSSGGLVTGIAGGSATIIYTVTNACGTGSASMTVTVDPLPVAGSVTGAANVCVGATTTMSDATPGGVWSTGNTNASISSAGLLTGLVAGTVPVSYSVSNVCGTAVASMTVTVDPLPNAGVITGATSVCVSSTITLTDAVAGGVWSSSNTNVTVAGGLVTGMVAGTSVIMYSVTNTCGTVSVSHTVTINSTPVAGTITGASTLCAGTSVTLVSSVPGGMWSSSSTSITVSGGVVTGLSAGVATITYTVTNACGSATATKVVTISPMPNAGTIYGPSSVCLGSRISVTNGATGGIWSTSNALIATVNSVGLVTPVSIGIVNIEYTMTTSCGSAMAIHAVTVNQCGGGPLVNNAVTANQPELKVYPNPNKGIFTFNLLSGVNEEVRIVITNVVGQKVGQFVTTTNKATELTLSQPAGVYVLTAITANASYITKVTLE